jgi:flavin reductase (DIM6/NTAB) family NADH-FMN oxidoreductase RutF
VGRALKIETKGMPTEALYKLLTGSVAPRPIAWVTTVSPAGLPNAAPFSAFTLVCNQPPMLLVNAGRIGGVQKDTARNIEATGCFTVNVVTAPLLATMNESSAFYPPDVAEPDVLGIELIKGDLVASPRIAASPVSMECRLHRVLEFGVEGSQSFVGEVLAWHIDDAIYSNGKIDQRKLNPVGRIGGAVYTTLGELIPMPAPYLPTNWKAP